MPDTLSGFLVLLGVVALGSSLLGIGGVHPSESTRLVHLPRRTRRFVALLGVLLLVSALVIYTT